MQDERAASFASMFGRCSLLPSWRLASSCWLRARVLTYPHMAWGRAVCKWQARPSLPALQQSNAPTQLEAVAKRAAIFLQPVLFPLRESIFEVCLGTAAWPRSGASRRSTSPAQARRCDHQSPFWAELMLRPLDPSTLSTLRPFDPLTVSTEHSFFRCQREDGPFCGHPGGCKAAGARGARSSNFYFDCLGASLFQERQAMITKARLLAGATDGASESHNSRSVTFPLRVPE